ncbi:MAG: MBL fold metallo-hydrolase [Armatimonadota bacterium]
MAVPTTLTFIGTASCTPPAGDDTACFLLNGHVLVDCGWCAALSMLPTGHDPTALSDVLITHCHHDHYLGLASVLFYRAMNKGRIRGDPELIIGGPADDIARVVELAQDFLQVERHPTVHAPQRVMPITPGDSFRIDELDVRTAPTRHPVQGLAYRFLDMDTGATIGISGDTAYRPALAEFFRGVDLLIMEGSTGLSDPPADNISGHSSVVQSARVARDAQVGRLALVHVGGGERQELLAAARQVFPNAFMPGPGDTMSWGSPRQPEPCRAR